MVDDSATREIDIATLKGIPIKTFLQRTWNKCMTLDAHSQVVTVGSFKSRGEPAKYIDYKTGYASSVFLLNVQATYEAGAFFNTQHIFAEDVCFNVLCVATGLQCKIDPIYTHRKQDINLGGACSQQAAGISTDSGDDVDDFTSLLDGCLLEDTYINLPDGLTSCRETLTTISFNNGFVVGGSTTDKVFACTNSTDATTISFDKLVGIYSGFEQTSFVAIDNNGFSLKLADGETEPRSIFRSELKMSIAAANDKTTC
jgi:hypothetical protein